MIAIQVIVDGTRRRFEVAAGATLLEALRSGGFKGVKDGCSAGDCGACAVMLDGQVVNACSVFAARADGTVVTTVEGLARGGELHPLQRAFLDSGGVQCGFCTPGMLMAAVDLLSRNPAPTEADVKAALAGSYCRCTGYVKPVQAVLRAAELLRETDDE